MKFTEYRRKKWREILKYDRSDFVNVEEMTTQMRETFGHLCQDCQNSKNHSCNKGNGAVVLLCPFYQLMVKEEQRFERKGQRHYEVSRQSSGFRTRR